MKYCIVIALAFVTNSYAISTEQFINLIDKNKTLQGFFLQTTEDNIGTSYQPETGKFYVKRPNKFIWQYDQEDGQKIVSTGTRIWIEQPDLQQVSHTTIDNAIKSSPIAILLSPRELSKHFKLISKPKVNSQEWLELVPLDKENLTFETLSVGIEDGNIKSIRVTDSFARTVTIVLYITKQNHPINDNIFDYQPIEYNDRE